jgi:hypothetical protein
VDNDAKDAAHHWSTVSLTPLTIKSAISKSIFLANLNLYAKGFNPWISVQEYQYLFDEKNQR